MDPVNAGLGLGDKTVGILDKLLGPWFTRRQADANTHVALQEVLTDQAAAYMEEHPNDPVMMEAIMSCHGRFGFDNIVRIVRLGIPQLNEEARPDLISDDWGANFKDKAHTCSDPEMAELWAQLLATEANHPGSFSRKTVNVLADLEPDDARLFKVLCDFRLTPVDVVKRSTSGGELEASFRRASGDSKLVVLDDRHAVYTAMGINFHSLARLEWLGLIRYVTPWYGEQRNHDRYLCYQHGNGQLFLAYNGFIPFGRAEFVPAGTQLSELCTPLETPDGFVDYIAEFWRGQGVRVAHTLSEAVSVPS